MLVYEVNIHIDEGIQDEFVPWLEEHIREMLKVQGFQSAELFQEENAPCQFCVHYFVESSKDLQNYLENQASQMRGEGVKRFAGQMQIHRRVLHRRGVF